MKKLHVNIPPRVETEPVVFVYENGNEDWPGIFIRGDSAGYYAYVLKQLLSSIKEDDMQNILHKFQLQGLVQVLESSHIMNVKMEEK